MSINIWKIFLFPGKFTLVPRETCAFNIFDMEVLDESTEVKHQNHSLSILDIYVLSSNYH